MNIVKTSPHTEAVVSALRAAGLLVLSGGPEETLAQNGNQKTWGWVNVAGQSVFRAYVILYSMSGGVFDGPLGCPDDDAELIYQATCVAEDQRRCEWVADEVTHALVGQELTVDGRSICRVSLDMTGGCRRDDTVQPPTYISTPRFRVASTPA